MEGTEEYVLDREEITGEQLLLEMRINFRQLIEL